MELLPEKAQLLSLLGDNVANAEIKGKKVIDLLTKAVIEKKVLISKNGHLSLNNNELDIKISPTRISHKASSNSKYIDENRKKCQFLISFLYEYIYEKKQAPLGCKNCYKVKIETNKVYALSLINEISKNMECNSKCGIDIDNQYSQCLYAAYFYIDGLSHAKEFLLLFTNIIEENTYLKDNTCLSLKRGCTNYEVTLGRSDQWKFDESLGLVEDKLYELFKPVKTNKPNKYEIFASWLTTAYRVGDNSYLKLTKGKRLYPKLLDYNQNIDNQNP